MSDEEKIEEETYSTIFSSLKHPIRRKILRMLAREPRTFSEILEAVSIDSGHLNYHLENLGDLITHSPDGKYGLSSVGVAAVKLMSGVEEHPPVAILLKSRRRAALNIITKITVIVLIVALIASSLFSIGFVQYAEGLSRKGGVVKVAIASNQVFEYNVTLVFKEEGPYFTQEAGNPFIWERGPLINAITRWDKCLLLIWLEINETVEHPEMNIRIKHYDLTGKALLHGYTYRGWEVYLERLGSIPPVRIEITQNGTYMLELENVGTEQINGIITPDLRFSHYKRPYFYWGIAGLLIASAYPAFALVRRVWG